MSRITIHPLKWESHPIDPGEEVETDISEWLEQAQDVYDDDDGYFAIDETSAAYWADVLDTMHALNMRFYALPYEAREQWHIEMLQRYDSDSEPETLAEEIERTFAHMSAALSDAEARQSAAIE